MGHRIAEAIIENGILKHIDRKLPQGKVKVHIIYDDTEEIAAKQERLKAIKETFGIYKNLEFEADSESKKLREEWERSLGK